MTLAHGFKNHEFLLISEKDILGERQNRRHKKITSKYRGLTEYLLKANEDRIVLTYPDIEKILGFALPDSARKHMRAYWSNSETHSYAFSWLSIGYRTRVDIEESNVIFEKNLQI